MNKMNEDLPARIAKLPLDKRGYPVPWFVAWIKDEPDFRVVDPDKIRSAIMDHLCWVCGERLGAHLAFVIGPMCMINRTTAEPPTHRGCAEFSVRTCPFLLNPDQKRNPKAAKCEVVKPAGFMITRNPGVTVVWITKNYLPFSDGGGGVLFKISDPERVEFYREGRKATRNEVVASIESGFHHLYDMAKEDGEKAVTALFKAKSKAYEFLPSAD